MTLPSTASYQIFSGGMPPYYFSPNGRYVAYRLHGSVIVRDRENGWKETLQYAMTEMMFESEITWSRDSRYVFFGYYYTGIIRMDLQSEPSAIIYGGPLKTYDHSIAISPDSAFLLWSNHSYGTILKIFKAPFPESVIATSNIVIQTDSYKDELQYSRFINDQQVILMVEGRLHVLDLSTGKMDPVQSLPLRYSFLSPMFLNTGKILFNSLDDSTYGNDISMLDTTTWTQSVVLYDDPRDGIEINVEESILDPSEKYVLYIGARSVVNNRYLQEPEKALYLRKADAPYTQWKLEIVPYATTFLSWTP